MITKDVENKREGLFLRNTNFDVLESGEMLSLKSCVGLHVYCIDLHVYGNNSWRDRGCVRPTYRDNHGV